MTESQQPASDEAEKSSRVVVVGSGPAGLMAAEVLALTHSTIRVEVYEAKSSMGRKLLVAGKGGLNLTHSEPFDQFVSRFGPASAAVRPKLESFGPSDVREWAGGLGIETFIGGSGRVFPQDLKALPLLNAWLTRLRSLGVVLCTGHRWEGWSPDGELLFRNSKAQFGTRPDAVILALGGGSWPKLGSDGAWLPWLSQRGISTTPLLASNCGFEVAWSPHLIERYAGEPLKSVGLSFSDTVGNQFSRQGACVVTETGLEGSLIYASSSLIRNEIRRSGTATIHLDLTPDISIEKLTSKLSVPRGSKSMASHLRRQARLKGLPVALLRELAADCFSDSDLLAAAIKRLPVRLTGVRPMEEAISTAGGVCFEELDERLMVKSQPGLFVAGEMLDWEAPTGGYLLTGCLASGRCAGLGAAEWIAEGLSAV